MKRDNVGVYMADRVVIGLPYDGIMVHQDCLITNDDKNINIHESTGDNPKLFNQMTAYFTDKLLYIKTVNYRRCNVKFTVNENDQVILEE